MIDNSSIVEKFVPEEGDDVFIYTELLDRSKRKGNNGLRMVKTFYHRSREEFRGQLPMIKQFCDFSGVRACTRLAPRSFAAVGRTFTRLVVEASLTDNWAGMKTLYNKACGTTSPIQKIWIWDVDVISEDTLKFREFLQEKGVFITSIPSKKGAHYVSKPFDTRLATAYLVSRGITDQQVSLHKDNPTNLYIPEGAA